MRGGKYRCTSLIEMARSWTPQRGLVTWMTRGHTRTLGPSATYGVDDGSGGTADEQHCTPQGDPSVRRHTDGALQALQGMLRAGGLRAGEQLLELVHLR